MASQPQYPRDPIAIVGSACRFAGRANSPSKLWDLLKHPHDVLSEIPLARFNAAKFYHPDALHSGTSNGEYSTPIDESTAISSKLMLIKFQVRHSYLLNEDHRLFDAHFFDVKPVEAAAIDPQQRILLEITYEALEAAGIPLEKIRGSNIGVYVGLMIEEYSKILGTDMQKIPAYFASGTARNNISNRISYFFDLHGPSMTIDTACSSSLVALHQAVISLRAGETSSALVAGANLILTPDQYVVSSKLKMLSPSGRCRMWDIKADGYGRGDGFGVLVLKTLSQAMADGDAIECIIRGTSVNQDGRTKGLTMPNPRAQADLIKNTYKQAGLDLDMPQDRPQFFEAHGTGTPAGDPVEAEAISSAFFGSDRTILEEPLLVGSAKTILGHTEGTAGILGVMKASLALQHGIVPPNMLLDDLNPNVQPFYANLRIPNESRDWPKIPTQSPRRASVNSFGFGGTNAHAILENFVGHITPTVRTNVKQKHLLAPFNFSAASESSLRLNLSEYASYLRKNPLVDLWDLAWTLNCRRSRLPVSISIPASSAYELAQKLEDASNSSSDEGITTTSRLAIEESERSSRVLGIFTGQGAQWVAMGRHLLEASPLVEECFQTLQSTLEKLPKHAPTWSLREELLRDASTSHVSEGWLSQPLCTAIQIALVQLLKTAGVTFAAVVGHSSGEIAAAYAAGYLSAEDAIRVAYFRGLFLERACAGAMLAVGTTPEDARKLCDLRSLRGRICVAATNSPINVTLSGNADAIQDAWEIFEDENKFARILNVDKAYHSHHMAPIADIYIQTLRDCGIQLQTRRPGVSHPTWISSVTGKNADRLDLDGLRGDYWGDNMKDPVMFSQAVECAIQTSGPFDVIIEIGPHPALKTPVSQTITAASGLDRKIPYVATLVRGKNDTEALASTLGSLWQHGMVIKLDGLARHPPTLLKNLPTYAWDHNRIFWHETRRARAARAMNGSSIPHPLLGTRCEDEAEGELRFRNRLNIRDLSWLADHRIQGQVVLPGSAYVCACLEAAMIAFPLSCQDVRLVELRDVVIRKALVFPEGVRGVEGGVELLLCIRLIEEDPDHIRATFNFSSSSDAMEEGTAMTGNCSGELIVFRHRVGERHEDQQDALPPPRQLTLEGISLNLQPSTFYDWANELGYGYQGYFRGLSDIKRKINTSTGRLRVPSQNEFILHPAVLDLGIQAMLLAYCCPGDGRLRSLHMPTRIDLLRIDPALCQLITRNEPSFFSSVAPSTDLNGQVELHIAGRTLVQMQGLHATPMNPPAAENDSQIFFEMVLKPEIPMSSRAAFDPDSFDADHAQGISAERVACYYFRKLIELFPSDSRENLQWYHIRLLEYVDFCIARAADGTHPYAQPEWMADTEENINNILQQYSSIIDFRIMAAAGDGLPRAIQDKGKTNMWEVLKCDGMLDDYYRYGQTMPEYLGALTDIVAQLSHRFAHMDILEVGAGTGAATGAILDKLHGAFRSFTFTDISSSFFPDAAAKLASFEHQIKFQPLDIEKPPADQGFTERSYDLVVASLVLHATTDLTQTLANVRRLLRPGGYLVMLELTETDPLRIGLIFGGFAGWWLGSQADGRHVWPCVSVETWGNLMQNTGFSKIDAIVPAVHELPAPLSVLVYQALDERIEFLRNPLTLEAQTLRLESLTIIGGGELLFSQLYTAMARHYQRVQYVASLADFMAQGLPAAGTVVSLLEAAPDEAQVFENLTEVEFGTIQKMFRLSKIILWVSRGCLIDRPYSNMFRGLARSAKLEMSNVRVQNLDIDVGDPFEWQTVASSLLQLEACGVWEEESRFGDLLWQCEPELFIRNGVTFVPRLKQSKARNDRYNSTRRFIAREVSVRNTPLRIRREGRSLKTEETCASPRPFGGEIRLVHSLLKAVPVGAHNGYLSVGEITKTHQHVLVLTSSLESLVYVPQEWTLPVLQGPNDGRTALLLLQGQLLSLAIVRATLPMRTLVVFNPDDLVGNMLLQLTAKEGIRLLLMTTKHVDCRRGWVRVHPRETRRAIQNLLPSSPFTFVDMAEHYEDSEPVHLCLPPGCKVYRRTDLFLGDGKLDSSPVGIRDAANHLQAAYTVLTTMAFEPVDLSSVREVGIDTLHLLDMTRGAGKANEHHEQAIVSWLASEMVSIQIQPASHQLFFRSDRTYWLVGLTGGLGPGLCEFMADRGATYIAVSSRHPQMDSSWIHSMASRGCTIRTFANDVTDRDSLRALHKEIMFSMPPIAGVCQGAMVLRDSVLPDLSYSQLRETLAPKVDGSLHLDELFSDDTLDFFVFFSSLAYVAGNRGQSAYTAANAFMASLAASRRKRGLVGSVMNMSGIVGEGYITRQLALGKQSALIKAGFDFQSEQAFHELFSEAVLAGHPGSEGSLEITTGVRVGENQGVSFANNPIFQHLLARKGTGNVSHTGPRSNFAIKALLLDANTHDEVFDIIRDGVLANLEAALHVKLTKSSVMPLRPDQLGVDSLIAVEIQSWLAKELGVDLSVMRILNSISIQDLVGATKDALSPDKVPKLNRLVADSENGSPEPTEAYSTDLSSDHGTSTDIELELSLDSSNFSSVTSSLDARSDPIISTSLAVVPELPTISVEPNISSSNAISNVRLERSVPMSFAQTRFWFLKFAVDDQAAFNVTTVVELQGSLDSERISGAFKAVVQRHEAIRTAFYTDDITKLPMQGVLASSPLQLEREMVARNDQIENAIREMRYHHFDLSAGESVRLKLLSLPGDRHVLILGYHHIAMDGIGNQIFFSDLESAYNNTLDIYGAPMLQYPDFTLKQRQDLKRRKWEDHLQYWRNQFGDFPPPLPLLDLTHKAARPETTTYASHSVKIHLDATLKTRIRECSHHWGVSPFHFYLAVFRVFLVRHTNFETDDLCIGVADSNRKDVDILRSLGLFLNLLPLRFRQSQGHSFVDVLRNTKLISDAAFAHSRIPIDLLFSELNVSRSRSQQPLFQAFLNYQQNISDARAFCGCEAAGELVSGGETGYDVSLDIVDSKTRENTLIMIVNSNLYTTENASVLLRSYMCLLQEFVANPVVPMSRPQLYHEEDIIDSVELGRGPERSDSQWPPTVGHRIDNMIETFRDKVALTDGSGCQLTYWEMVKRAEEVAMELRRFGVGHGCFVGLFQAPGPDWVCSFLGVLRAGACCVPLDRRLELGRLLLISQDCKPQVILIDKESHTEKDFLQSTGVHIICASNIPSGAKEGELQPNQGRATDAAVITYTSGSTGVPKGSTIRHMSYRNFCEFSPTRWGVELGTETVLQQSSYAFDLSIGQILVCLCYGGTLVIPSEMQRCDPAAICDLMVQEGITFTIATPTEYFAWLRHDNGRLLQNSRWHTAITAGETVTKPLVEAFASLADPEMHLINVYGPSETTIGCADQLILPCLSPSEFEDDKCGLSTLPNYSIYIVDANFKPVPVGVPGQVLIGGAGVAEGYLNRDELTPSAFVYDDQASALFCAHGWLSAHVSGDRGRLDSQGRLILHGRIEDSTQIKMGGVRIDLQDIESTIMAKSRRIHQAVVSHRVSAGLRAEFLAAFVVLDGHPDEAGGVFDRDSFLEGVIRDLPLPQIMRPAIAVAVDALPTTISNKIDRLAVGNMTLAEFVPLTPEDEKSTSSLDEFEDMLYSLWYEALPEDIARIHSFRDRNADFFVVGGNSLSLLTLQSLIRERLGIAVSIMNLFGASTLGQMAIALRGQSSWNFTVTPEIVDWEQETTVPPDFASLSQSSRRHKQTPQTPGSTGVVVLTGSTGFLGQRILCHLVQDPMVSKVHCVAVRKPLEKLPELFINTKITVHRGDLRFKQLGLSDHVAATIFAEASVVVHCGANVSFLESYHSLRHTNLASTKELARLSLSRRLPLHYISTASVTQLTRASTWGPTSVAAFLPVSGRLNGFGYKSTKWAGETFLERVSQTLGLPVVVHRPTSITGEGAPETDLMGSVMRFAQKAKAVPDASSWQGYLDFVDVDTVAMRVTQEVAKSIQSIGDGEGDRGSVADIRYVYENGDVVIGVEHLGKHLEDLISETPTVMTFSMWVDALAKAGMNPFLVKYLNEVDDGELLLFPKLVAEIGEP
ncbi:hypothetical protein ANO14919_056580 [Xylariales sp. No.14919]|nr:hypothetical protein ANO14919_056580 [Xylariales sp. No.14919]